MADAELLELHEESANLTDVARAELQTEITRRKLDTSRNEPREMVPDPKTAGAPPVIVGSYQNLAVAQMAKGQLDSAGIESMFIDDNVVSMLYANAVGGVKIAVRAKDAEEARTVLEQPMPEKFEVDGVGEYEQPRCPKCNSAEITFEALDKPIAYGSMWLGVPIPYEANRWHCEACGTKWEEGPEEPTDKS
jgi:hypothetical protein